MSGYSCSGRAVYCRTLVSVACSAAPHFGLWSRLMSAASGGSDSSACGGAAAPGGSSIYGDVQGSVTPPRGAPHWAPHEGGVLSAAP